MLKQCLREIKPVILLSYLGALLIQPPLMLFIIYIFIP